MKKPHFRRFRLCPVFILVLKPDFTAIGETLLIFLIVLAVVTL
jgi:hypothetical protein